MPMTHVLRHGLYPLLLLVTLAYLAFELRQPSAQLGHHYPAYLGAMVLVLAVTEARWPLRRAWRMTGATWWRRDQDEATSPGVQPGVERSSRNGLPRYLYEITVPGWKP